MNPSEHCLYQVQSPRTIISFGYNRSAILTGMAVLMPSFFAGIEAAVTMLLLSDGSPDTTAGTSLMSDPPSDRILTAIQLRKAEFTSMWNITRLKISVFR